MRISLGKIAANLTNFFRCSGPHPFCDSKIEQDYKFYAAFEHVDCKDFVSAGFFEALKRNIIPLVWGGANYSNFAPPHSFIDVSSYESFDSLLNYLKILSSNPAEYVKYFWWKKDYRIVEGGVDYCGLCQYMNKPGMDKRIKFYVDLKRYWLNGSCH